MWNPVSLNLRQATWSLCSERSSAQTRRKLQLADPMSKWEFFSLPSKFWSWVTLITPSSTISTTWVTSSTSFTRFIMSTLLGHFEQVAWEEGSDTVWRTTEAGMEEEDKEVWHHGLESGTHPFIVVPSGVFQLCSPRPLSWRQLLLQVTQHWWDSQGM